LRDAAGAARAGERAYIPLIRIKVNRLTFSEFHVTILLLTFERRDPDRGKKARTPQAIR
jgi:hypothetical protein